MGPAGIAVGGGSGIGPAGIAMVGGNGMGPAGIAVGGSGIGPAGIAVGGNGIGPAGIANAVHAETRRTARKATFKRSIVRVPILTLFPAVETPPRFAFTD
jgi:hypothetical protein